MRILIVEDEKKMAGFLDRGLREEGYAVDIAYDGEKGWEYAVTNEYDVLILDWMLPRMSGVDLCKKIRNEGRQVPILILTARDTVEDKIQGLDVGADDYLTKPFSFDELLARLRALLRRPHRLKDKTVLECGTMTMDLIKRRVVVEGEEIALSQKEFSLLEYLLRHEGEVVSRTAIAEHVWDLHFDPMSNTIDVYINFLRKKFGEKNIDFRIETVRGTGYRLVSEK
ncbi:MAG TPA: response regulator transcription factor [Candidatus Omnitrophota bacterium]|jgi:DNA-binding response OmpR family regulator|nr:response regulator transcription factor [Candidatus Omnitrophota bacterium]HQB94671.1 response regulator transcription factor [Candidatus Omnitrophota bacterium]